MGLLSAALRGEEVIVNGSDSVSAKSGLYDLLAFAGFGGSKNKRFVNYNKALDLPAFWNGVDQISSTMGIMPFQVFKRTALGRERAYDHPVDRLLGKEPDGENGYLTPFIFKKMSMTSVLLRGNCLWQIVTSSDGTQKLKYHTWDDVDDIRKIKDENGNKQLVYLVKGEPLLSNEVLHFKGFTHDGIVGVSVIKHACTQLGIALEIQDFSYTNFEHKGARQGVLSTDLKVTADAKKALAAGFRGAVDEKTPTRVAVLDEGMKYTPISVTPQEAQLIESGRFSIEDIARWLNLPPHKIKSLQQSTNNNIEQQGLEFWSDTMQPWVTNFEEEFFKKLFMKKEKSIYRIKGIMGAILRSDMKSKGEYYSKMVNSGIILPNEVRAWEELDRLPGGDELRIPVNTKTQSQIEEESQNNNGNE